MHRDPYVVLGVSRNATDDEVKQAYRKLAKRYHPDLHPGDKAAAEKMNELNAAYDEIKNPPPKPEPDLWRTAGRPGGQHQQYQQRQQRQSAEFQAAEHFIRMHQFRDAMNVLAGIPIERRSARWYFLSAMASYGAGNRIAGLEYMRRAANMEPGNEEYRQMLVQMEQSSRMYRTSPYGAAASVSSGALCLGACVAPMLCRFCFWGF